MEKGIRLISAVRAARSTTTTLGFRQLLDNNTGSPLQKLPLVRVMAVFSSLKIRGLLEQVAERVSPLKAREGIPKRILWDEDLSMDDFKAMSLLTSGEKLQYLVSQLHYTDVLKKEQLLKSIYDDMVSGNQCVNMGADSESVIQTFAESQVLAEQAATLASLRSLRRIERFREGLRKRFSPNHIRSFAQNTPLDQIWVNDIVQPDGTIEV